MKIATWNVERPKDHYHIAGNGAVFSEKTIFAKFWVYAFYRKNECHKGRENKKKCLKQNSSLVYRIVGLAE